MLADVSGQTDLSEEIRASTQLPSKREQFFLTTTDSQSLVAELAEPITTDASAVLLMLHPLPTHGGFMDSHILRKAANRLPALANIAVLRFNTRGTESPQGKSSGAFDDGENEKFDLHAAYEFLVSRGFTNIWLVGWSFGTELALKYGPDLDIAGAILLSPPLHRTSDDELMRWNQTDSRLVALIPEFDEFLTPSQAKPKFALVPKTEFHAVADAKHLWVGEIQTRAVLNLITQTVNPVFSPLPTVWP